MVVVLAVDAVVVVVVEGEEVGVLRPHTLPRPPRCGVSFFVGRGSVFLFFFLGGKRLPIFGFLLGFNGRRKGF